MAKGRRLTASRSERLLGSYSTFSNGHVFPDAGEDSPELGEEDVWPIVDDGGERDEILIVENSDWSPPAIAGCRRRGVPRDGRYTVIGGLSAAFDESAGGKAASPRVVHQWRGRDSVAGRQMATSAPVNVPDWSKILRVDSVESLRELDDGFDDGDSAEMVPPHEYLARSRKSGGASVFEGIGRTLKGRDLRRVRDAVWSQTGFDG